MRPSRDVFSQQSERALAHGRYIARESAVQGQPLRAFGDQSGDIVPADLLDRWQKALARPHQHAYTAHFSLRRKHEQFNPVLWLPIVTVA